MWYSWRNVCIKDKPLPPPPPFSTWLARHSSSSLLPHCSWVAVLNLELCGTA